VQIALGEAYQNGAWDERSLAALLKAAEIDPDHVELQADIGRQLLAKGDAAEGVRRLRLALMASDAANQTAATATAQLHLHKALRDTGYLTAAVDLLERVRARVANPSLDVRMSPELYFYVNHPEYLSAQAGQLYDQLGRYEEALAAYAAVANADPSNFENRARVIRTLVNVGRTDEAAEAAAEAVGRFKASAESVRLLREVYAAIGRDGRAAEELRKLHEHRPDDRSILYALADLLSADGEHAAAVRVLERAAARDPDDFEIVRRLVILGQDAQPDPTAAAARLVRWSAGHPDSIHLMASLWAQLVRPRPEGRIRPATVDTLSLGPSPSTTLQAAKLFWVARVAQASDRRVVARDALDRGVAINGAPYPPAYRAQLDALWSRNDLSQGDRTARSQELAARAKQQGNEPLAARAGRPFAVEPEQADRVPGGVRRCGEAWREISRPAAWQGAGGPQGRGDIPVRTTALEAHWRLAAVRRRVRGAIQPLRDRLSRAAGGQGVVGVAIGRSAGGVVPPDPRPPLLCRGQRFSR
jgi:tetratricopeptide (TPR) repeat protein